ncbi:lysophospholipid acyltransferase family protein [Parahaliea aestuarii]|uniref:1-acyl-sn-glycerol-3-phosphate acyltransferase n=1 Tax=Parahaliea aestuarii TaxID=1852021 RepID=A0A5C8ZRK8_9GAMM|nr:lysophospholipid acyltransferase family protein [Parahaliea aestuarii]TXS90444.1 1-acyl-sn-glycerol-3-phosphate acyltransferase [Parahaliea aestuarii]
MRAWRVIATGLCFASFGLAGLLLGYVLLPLVHLFSPDPAVAVRRSRRWVQRACRAFIALMQQLGVLSWEFQQSELLNRPGVLIVANHPSLIDVIFLVSQSANTACIARDGLFRNPFTRGPLRWAGYLPNRNASQLLKDCAASLATGTSLVVFPEGTRSTPGTAPHLLRGAAHLCLRSSPPLVLVRIKVRPPTLYKGMPWYRVPTRRPHFQLQAAAAPIPAEPAALAAAGRYSLAARRLTRHWQDYFTCENSL